MLHHRIPMGIAVRPVAFNQDVKAILPDASVDPWFLHYWLRAMEPKLLSMVDFTGIGAGKLDTFSLQQLEFEVPSLQEQQRRYQLVKALDDKIELNRRICATLEEMARAIFRSWFVDFDPVRAKVAAIAEGRDPERAAMAAISGKSEEDLDSLPPEALASLRATAALFPHTFEESELGETPLGWPAKRVDEISQKVGMGPFGSNIKVSTFVESGVPVISGKHLNQTLLEDTSYNFVTEPHAARLENSCVGPGDLVFTHAGNIGQASFIPEDSEYQRYILSQRQFFLRPDVKTAPGTFLIYFFRSPEGQHKLLSAASQVGVPSIARPVTHLRSITLRLPTLPLLQVFDRLVGPLHSLISLKRSESETLATLRDTLLPKLLSGELLISEAAQEEVVLA